MQRHRGLTQHARRYGLSVRGLQLSTTRSRMVDGQSTDSQRTINDQTKVCRQTGFRCVENPLSILLPGGLISAIRSRSGHSSFSGAGGFAARGIFCPAARRHQAWMPDRHLWGGGRATQVRQTCTAEREIETGLPLEEIQSNTPLSHPRPTTPFPPLMFESNALDATAQRLQAPTGEPLCCMASWPAAVLRRDIVRQPGKRRTLLSACSYT